MEELLADFKRAEERVTALYETEAYRKQCDRFTAECKRLEQLGFDFLENQSKDTTDCTKSVVRWEFASGCRYLHRGVYTPSLLFPHIIYGAQRGRILSRITSRSNPCFEYGFNDANQLVLCKSLDKGQVRRTEYLLYEQDRILGFTLNSSGDLESVSEEVYENGRPAGYVYAPFAFYLEPPGCNELSYEEYEWDIQGNVTGHWHSFMLPPHRSSDERDFGLPSISVPVYNYEVYTIPGSSM